MTKQGSRIVSQWFAKSAENLRLAKSILQLQGQFYDHICFNAQQSAEKAIKGYLTAQKIRFDKTHDIAVLTALVRTVDANLAEQLKEADQLTKYAVRIRYPEETGEPLVVDKNLALRMIEIADGVYNLLHAQIDGV